MRNNPPLKTPPAASVGHSAPPLSLNLAPLETSTFSQGRLLPLLSIVMVLVTLISAALVWQSINNVREINRQKTLTALGDVVASFQKQILIAQLMARSIQAIVITSEEDMSSCAHFCLRTALTSAVSAFKQGSHLSQLGLVLPGNDVFGNLERLENGNIALWLSPEGKEAGQPMQKGFLWTGNGFMPYLPAQMTGNEGSQENLRRLRVQEMASQQGEEGAWQLRDSSWMMQEQIPDSGWGIGYSKSLHDDRGRLIGVFDTNFSLDDIQATMQTLQQRHGIRITMVAPGERPWMIRTDRAQPVALTPELISLVEAQDNSSPGEFLTDVLYLEEGRHWAAAAKLSLQGTSDWQLVITRHVPWREVMTGEQTIYILAIALVLIIGSGVVIGFLMLCRGRARNLKIHADFEHLATHDDLTGLPNRMAMQHRLGEAITKAREDDNLVALLYLTLDRFKAINDNYGYLFGNHVLRAVGETLANLIRGQDMVAYLSGDRFLILLDKLHHRDEAYRLTRQITEAIKQPLLVQEREIHVATSIGVSLYPTHGDTPNMLINHADIAMYAAKRQGGDTYQFFTPEMGQIIQENTNLEMQLHDAIAENQLHLVYQPKVSLHDGKITGCEALLRWTHPELGLIPPSRFIPITENAGLIVAIGDWVLKTACYQAKAWLDNGLEPVCVAVNLSMRQFLRRDVVKWVADILQHTGLPAHCLELELTESLLPQDMERTLTILDQLHALGIKLSLDDFGTGYSNLSYLKRLSIDTLKIDQAFVRGALGSTQDAAIVGAVVELAHNLGLKALAEGVETPEQLDFVRQQQCDELQGYYFSPPVAAETYAIMLRDGITLK